MTDGYFHRSLIGMNTGHVNRIDDSDQFDYVLLQSVISSLEHQSGKLDHSYFIHFIFVHIDIFIFIY